MYWFELALFHDQLGSVVPGEYYLRSSFHG